jgi:hypothetical protein
MGRPIPQNGDEPFWVYFSISNCRNAAQMKPMKFVGKAVQHDAMNLG